MSNDNESKHHLKLLDITKQVSPRQLELLLNFMEQHHSLALGRSRGKEASQLSNKLWSQCADILNSVSEGPEKSTGSWKQYYNQYKSRTKAKYRGIKQGLSRADGGPPEGSTLTPLEQRLINILEGRHSPPPVTPSPVDVTFDPGYEVESEVAQAIHRHAAAMENIAGAVHRFVDLYERNLQQNGRSRRHRTTRTSRSSRSSSGR